jgi:hypothetical protein
MLRIYEDLENFLPLISSSLAILNQFQELLTGSLVAPKQAGHVAGGHADAGFMDAPGAHALVGSLDYHADAFRF